MGDSRTPGKVPALVLGLGVHGLAIVRSLGRYGVPVEAAETERGGPWRHSRYCGRTYRLESLTDERLIEWLVARGRMQDRRAVLFITRDRTVPLISAHRATLEPYFEFVLPPERTVTCLLHKARLAEHLARLGVLHPRTEHVRGMEDIAAAGDVVGYPCVLKPAMRLDAFKAAIIDNGETLRATYARASQHGGEFIVQQWIAGGDRDVCFCYTYFDRDGRARAIFTGRKLRQFPRGTGIAVEAEGSDDPRLRAESLRVLEGSGYRGFGSTEFRRDKEGNLHLIEITVGRTDYNVGCAIANGVDLPAVGYADMVGDPDPVRTAQRSAPWRWMDVAYNTKGLWDERRIERRGRLRTVGLLLRSILGPRVVFALFDARDPGPFLALMLVRMGNLPRVMLRRVARRLARVAGISRGDLVHAKSD